MRWLAGGALTLLVACGAPAQSRQPDPQKVRADALARQVDDLKAEIGRMRSEMAGLRARLEVAEARAGIAPFSPRQLKPLEGAQVKLGKAAWIEGPNDRGRKQQITAQIGPHRGSVLAFWATWCQPCTSPEELAHLRHLQGELAKVDGALISLAVDERVSEVLGDPRAQGWVYPFWYRPDGHLKLIPRALVEQAGVGLPLFLVLDEAGNVLWWHNATLDESVIEEMVTAVARM